MDQHESLKQMVLAFRVTELQTLLSFAGKNRSGRKNELQVRALELVKSKQIAIQSKIRELYESIQLANLAQPAPASAGVINSNINLNLGRSNTYQTSINMSNNNYNNGRLYGGGYTGASEKMLMGRNPYSSNFPIKLTSDKSVVPYCPDVKLKRLPFYDILHVLHKPATLIPSSNNRGIQESDFTFCFTPSQANDIASSKEYNYSTVGENKIQYTTQVQLRFCAMETSCDQDDLFPPSIIVKVNQKLIPLPHPIPSNRPGVEAKRPSRPLNITNYCKLSPLVQNKIMVNWAQDASGRGYCLSVYMVKKLCSATLLGRLKNKGSRPSEYTKGMIKEICLKDDADCCIATTTLLVSIACPLGKSRMTLPCRASTCTHLQCFDANLFIQMNEKKPTWVCPVCDKPTLFDNLAIDGYFEDVISKVPIECGNEIEISPEASWKVVVKKDKDEPQSKKIRTTAPVSSKSNTTICIDEDDIIIEEDESKPVIATKSQPSEKNNDKEKSVEMVDLTLSDSDDEEPLPTRAPPPPQLQPVPPPSLPREPEPVLMEAEPATPIAPSVKTSSRSRSRENESRSRSRENESSSGNKRKVTALDVEEGEVKDSSEDDADEEVVRPRRKLPNRQARPTFLHDESSSSASSDSSASTRAPDSPQCITLDSESSSSSSSPEPPPRKATTRSTSNNNTTANFLSSGSAFAAGAMSSGASSSQQHQSQTTASTSYPSSSTHHLGATSSALPNPRYNSDAMASMGGYMNTSGNTGYQAPGMSSSYRGGSGLAPPPPILRRSPNNMHDLNHQMGMAGMGMGYQPTAQSMPPYMGFDSRPTSWDPTGFSATTDFAGLDYPSMDYFNQTPTYTNPNSRPGLPFGNNNPHGGGYGSNW